jgi:hypothetical protein
MNSSNLILSVAVTLLLASAPVLALPRDYRANYGAIRAGETQATENQCEMYHNWYVEDTQRGSDKDSAFDKDLAASRGCVWAQRTTSTTDTGTASGRTAGTAAP